MSAFRGGAGVLVARGAGIPPARGVPLKKDGMAQPTGP